METVLRKGSGVTEWVKSGMLFLLSAHTCRHNKAAMLYSVGQICINSSCSMLVRGMLQLTSCSAALPCAFF